MKKYLILLTALFALLFFSCQKLDDLLHKDKLVVKGCAIRTMSLPAGFDFDGSDARTATFSYNPLGQPTQILFNTQSQTGLPNNFLLRYDAQNRLTDFIATYDNGTFDSWNIFSYNIKGQITEDSVFIFGSLNGGPPSETDEDELAYNTYYTYDNEGRIRRAIDDHYPSIPDPEVHPYKDTSFYTYNNDGNLIRPGRTYDDKVNLNRINKIWMFLNRDYSRNNFRPAVRYNENGLPLEFTVGPIPFFFGFNENPSDIKVGNVRITYMCKDYDN